MSTAKLSQTPAPRQGRMKRVSCSDTPPPRFVNFAARTNRGTQGRLPTAKRRAVTSGENRRVRGAAKQKGVRGGHDQADVVCNVGLQMESGPGWWLGIFSQDENLEASLPNGVQSSSQKSPWYYCKASCSGCHVSRIWVSIDVLSSVKPAVAMTRCYMTGGPERTR